MLEDQISAIVDTDEPTLMSIFEAANDTCQIEPVEILLAALSRSFIKVFSDRDAPILFNEGHGHEAWNAIDRDCLLVYNDDSATCSCRPPRCVTGTARGQRSTTVPIWTWSTMFWQMLLGRFRKTCNRLCFNGGAFNRSKGQMACSVTVPGSNRYETTAKLLPLRRNRICVYVNMR